MDVFFEQVIVRKNNKVIYIFKGIILILVFLFCNFVLSNTFRKIGVFALLVYVLSFGITFYIFSRSKFEFEYSFTNGELDIDRIIAKKKRVRLTSFNSRNLLDFGHVTELSLEERNKASIPCVYAHDGITDNIYFAEYKYDNQSRIRLYFSPNDNILAAIKTYLSPELKKKLLHKEG